MTDANGRPISLFMTARQVSDYTGAATLLESRREPSFCDVSRSRSCVAVPMDVEASDCSAPPYPHDQRHLIHLLAMTWSFCTRRDGMSRFTDAVL